MLHRNELVHAGIAAAIAEINRRHELYEQAEIRLAAKMKPALLNPLNHSHENGRAASDAVMEAIRSL